MRLLHTALTLFPLLTTFTTAWTPQDHEIFRLRDELTAAEGLDKTFYSFLGAKPSATLDDINKAYRSKSRTLHPDKAIPALIAKRSIPQPSSSKEKAEGKKPGAKVTKGPTQKERTQITREANERYARLGVIANILRNGESRERYDYFLSNGFPRWRGTGYYYERFRPGLWSVLVGLLVVFGGAVHYGAMYLGWKRHREFVERYIAHARKMAWGNESGVPGVPDVSAVVGSQAVTSGLSTPAGASEAEQSDSGATMPSNRRQKRIQDKENKKNSAKEAAKAARNARVGGVSKPVDGETISQSPQGARKKVVAENGKVLIVDSEGNVFLEESTEDGETHELLLDVSFTLSLLPKLDSCE